MYQQDDSKDIQVNGPHGEAKAGQPETIYQKMLREAREADERNKYGDGPWKG